MYIKCFYINISSLTIESKKKPQTRISAVSTMLLTGLHVATSIVSYRKEWMRGKKNEILIIITSNTSSSNWNSTVFSNTHWCLDPIYILFEVANDGLLVFLTFLQMTQNRIVHYEINDTSFTTVTRKTTHYSTWLTAKLALCEMRFCAASTARSISGILFCLRHVGNKTIKLINHTLKPSKIKSLKITI